MKKNLALVITSFIFLLSALHNELHSQTLLLEKLNVIDVRDGSISKNQYVLIHGDSIVYVGSKMPKTKKGMQRVVAEGKFLIPGLWDSHVHLTMVGESSLPLFVNSGVTQVRDMGGDYSQLKHWKSTRERNVPHIITSGPILESPQFVSLVNRVLGPTYSSTRIPIASTAQVGGIIDSLKSIGVDFIKVRTTSNFEIFKSIADECAKKNIRITGHISPTALISEVIASGISTIEHYDFLQLPKMTTEERDVALQAIEKMKPAFTPTLIAFQSSRLTPITETLSLLNDTLDSVFPDRKYLSPSLLEAWTIETKLNALESKINWETLDPPFIEFAKQIAGRTHALAGTDVGVRGIVPGSSLHIELQLMVEKLGISPLVALQSATINPSGEFGLSAKYGTVEIGKIANLVLLNSNPLLDIQNTHDIYAVIKEGRYLGGAEREFLLKEVELAVQKERQDFQSKSLEHLNKFLDSMKGK